MNDNNSLAHTTWNCKYHIVFAPKYRRKILLQEYRVEMGKILRELCDWKGIKIIEAEICPKHVHMFVEIPPKMSVSISLANLLFKIDLDDNDISLLAKSLKKNKEFLSSVGMTKQDFGFDDISMVEKALKFRYGLRAY